MNPEDIQPLAAQRHFLTRREELLRLLRTEFEDRDDVLQAVEACPVCGSRQRTEAFCKEFVIYSRCLECELLYQSRTIREAVRDAMYAGSEYFNVSTESIHLATYEHRKHGKCGPILQRLTVWADPTRPLRLLDVGCATGYFLELVGERTSWHGTGVEINETAAAFARSRGLNVRTGNVMYQDWPSESFDLIVCIGLLGRIAAPAQFMARCRELLSPRGVLLITTPNCSGFEMAVTGEHHMYFDQFDTPCGYTRKSVRQLLRNAGLEILSLTTPGEMDVEIVRRHVVELGLPVRLNDFERELVLSEEPGMEEVRRAFGTFLRQHGLSGLMEIVASKTGTLIQGGEHVP